MRVLSRVNNMFHSTELAALRDATVKQKAERPCREFSESLYNLVYGTENAENRFVAFCDMLGDLPRIKGPVVTWPIATAFPYIASPSKYMFVKPSIAKRFAANHGFALDYEPKPNWRTYSRLMEMSKQVSGDLSRSEPKDTFQPKDMIDVQSFIWTVTFVPKDTGNFELPDEVTEEAIYREGTRKSVLVNVYERDGKARAKCIEHYGTRCLVCGFDFEETFGELGKDFIHVHHLKNLASIGKEYQVDPIKDLRPVCPNCHAMLHKGPNGSLHQEIAGDTSEPRIMKTGLGQFASIAASLKE